MLSLKLRKVSAIEASKSAVQIETIDEPRFPDQEFSKHLKLFVKEKSKFDYLLSFLQYLDNFSCVKVLSILTTGVLKEQTEFNCLICTQLNDNNNISFC